MGSGCRIGAIEDLISIGTEFIASFYREEKNWDIEFEADESLIGVVKDIKFPILTIDEGSVYVNDCNLSSRQRDALQKLVEEKLESVEYDEDDAEDIEDRWELILENYSLEKRLEVAKAAATGQYRHVEIAKKVLGSVSLLCVVRAIRYWIQAQVKRGGELKRAGQDPTQDPIIKQLIECNSIQFKKKQSV